ncbi:nSTAND1 domain-containing NTPase [Saccharothrix sp. Mg75]|uniref:nSTAND1 domain-containing NTPase n=1 Tax=Saccharothrix sp. Mg75 TaxID=3445357 RepID=UPI003EEFA633
MTSEGGSPRESDGVHQEAVVSGGSHVVQVGRDQYLHFGDGVRRAVAGAVVDECPYPGIHAFTPDQAPWFFGRDGATADLVGRLDARTRTGGPQVVVAPSGAGKSSLLNAGLLARVEAGALPGSAHWPRVVGRPAGDPARAFATAVAAAIGRPAGDAGELLAPGACAAAVRAALGAKTLVVVVDQFEELFTVCPDERAQAEYVDLLCDLAAAGSGRAAALVVLGLRADFFAACARHPRLRAALQDNPVVVGPLSERDLRAAIRNPALAVGLTPEPGLVDVLLRDLGGPAGRPGEGPTGEYEADRLPMLAHALRSTWSNRDGSTMTVAGYEASGGIDGAIAATADRVLADLGEKNGPRAASLLPRLVKVGEGTADVRVRVPRDDLVGSAADAEVLEAFTRARLLTADEDAVAITHEALISAWPRLRQWIEADRHELVTHQRLGDAARTWAAGRRDPGLLYRGTPLADADALVRRSARPPTALEREFLDASLRARRSGTRRLRRLVAVLAALLVLTLVAAGAAVRQWNDAEDSRRAAEDSERVAAGRSLLFQAEAARDTEAGASLRLGVAAMGVNASPEARAGLVKTLMGNHYAATLSGHADAVHAVAFTPDGRTAVTGGVDPSLIVWDVRDPVRPRRVGSADVEGGVWSVAISRDGRTAVTGGPPSLDVWDIADPARPRRVGSVSEEPRWVSSVALSRDGRTVLTGTWDNSGREEDGARLWDLADPAAPRLLASMAADRSGPVRGVALGRDDAVAVVGNEDGTVLVWDVADRTAPRRVATLPDHGNSVWAVATSPDGRALLTGSADQTAILWDITDPVAPVRRSRLTGHRGTVRAVAFSPDGRTVVTGSQDRTAILWRVDDPVRPERLDTLGGHRQPVFTVAFGHDGAHLATGGSDDTAVVWRTGVDADPVRLGELGGHGGGAPSLVFGPGGHRMATGGADGALTTWDVADPRAPRPLATVPAHGGGFAMASNGAGTVLLTGGGDRTAVLWDVADWSRPRRLATLSGGRRGVASVGFAPAGDVVALGGDDGRFELWDVADPAHPRALATAGVHSARISAVLFGPDGRTLVTGSTDTTTVVWDVGDPTRPGERAAYDDENSTYSAVFSPDGEILALAQEGRKTTLLDLSDPDRPEPLAVVRGQASSVYAAAFSPDGRVLATGGYDKTALLWDVTDPRDPRELTSIRGHAIAVVSLLFGPDGRTLAISGGDTPALWDVARLTDIVARPVDIACGIVGEGLTERQWSTYAPDVAHRRTC